MTLNGLFFTPAQSKLIDIRVGMILQAVHLVQLHWTQDSVVKIKYFGLSETGK